MTFYLYRLLITLATSLPVAMLLACGVLYVVSRLSGRGRGALPDLTLLLFGVLLGLGTAAGFGWLVPLLVPVH